MKAHRLRHCLAALSSRTNLPLDRHLQAYFRAHHNLGSHDRRQIRSCLPLPVSLGVAKRRGILVEDVAFGVVRWRHYIDRAMLASQAHPSWADRVAAFLDWDRAG